MSRYLYNPRIFAFLAVFVLASCDDDENPSLRPKLDYSLITAETPYPELFVDASGNTTVDLTEGNTLHKMFQALNYQSTASVSNNLHIDAPVLKKMFNNEGDPFSDISTATISIVGADLNASDLNLRDVVASSMSLEQAEIARTRIETLFDEIEEASHSVTETASQGVAGKLGNYLVDEKGIEIAQIIQKSLIGALQLDYISNVLMDEGLTADNSKVISDKNYSQLEHNWDVAYGLLTLNQVYLKGSTNDARGTTEFALGSYLWEYNKANFSKLHPAFLKGRAAIVNNDRTELEAQATFLRTEFEKTLASAALGYLDKWKTGANDGARAHAIGEGLGFIYSLRFATIHGADAAFSDNIIDGLIGSEHGFWDLNVTKINAASDAIKAKFNL